MAAENIRGINTINKRTTIVTPTPVTDSTLLDSVAGFINEVTTATNPNDQHNQILWAHFETCDLNNDTLINDEDLGVPLVLALGHSGGDCVSVWAVNLKGDAQQILTWRQVGHCVTSSD